MSSTTIRLPRASTNMYSSVPRVARPLAALTLALLLLTQPGCDVLDVGTFPIHTRVTFTYDVHGSSLNPGEFTLVAPRDPVSIRTIVEGQGFPLDDVVEVRAVVRNRAPQVTVRQPLQAGVNHITRLNVGPRVNETVNPVVLRGANFSGSDTVADLQIVNANLSGNVAGGQLRLFLEIEPTTAVLDQAYQFDVAFDITIEVHG